MCLIMYIISKLVGRYVLKKILNMRRNPLLVSAESQMVVMPNYAMLYPCPT